MLPAAALIVSVNSARDSASAKRFIEINSPRFRSDFRFGDLIMRQPDLRERQKEPTARDRLNRGLERSAFIY
jgi:hypothetical protein